MDESIGCTAFQGSRRIASGKIAEVAVTVKETNDPGDQAMVLIFDDATGETIEFDFRGTLDDVRKRLVPSATRVEPTDVSAPTDPDSQRGPGRPKLGVVSREVTLLPRHWEWLNDQPGGASVALRKLVEEARRLNGDRDRVRHAREAAFRFMSTLAGDMPGFEEATRALFKGDPDRFDGTTASWPADIRDYARKLSGGAFPDGARTGAGPSAA